MRAPTDKQTNLVLVGGGHSHVQVLEGFAMEPPPNTRITLIVDRPVAMYSGMVPGFVAGQYKQEELEIDVLPLARRIGARVIIARAIRIEAEEKRVVLQGRPPVPFELASINIGSTVAGLSTPGVREHAIPTRPITGFVSRLDSLFDEFRASNATECVRIVVAGAGAGGVEVAFALDHRLRELGRKVDVTVIESGPEILAGYSAGMRRRAERAAGQRDIKIVAGQRIDRVEADRVFLKQAGASSKSEQPFDLLLWVTGAVSHPLFRDSNLPTDERGFVKIRSTLQLEDHDHIFAVGDCSTLTRYPRTPKAGVYAVRQGPVLTTNLRRLLAGEALLDRYRPQHDFLTLINTGDGGAIGGKWFLSFEGEWVFRLKDRIDRKFMYRFQPLDHPGNETAFDSAGMNAGTLEDGDSEVLCGGCAAKLGQLALERALSRLPPGSEDSSVELGMAGADDAACYSAPGGQRIVSSVDQFRSFTDDAYLVGRVAAINAASDLLAKGIEPRFAQALVALPERDSGPEQEETLFQLLAGAQAAFDEIGVTLLGGHTMTAAQLQLGFHLEGFADNDQRLLVQARLEAGQRLILSKALGTGVLMRADMRGELRGPWFEQALASMLRLNRDAVAVARRFGARAATDVTGFGLAGHLAGMLRAADLAATIDVRSLPALPGSLELLETGLRSTFHEDNAKAARGMQIEPEARRHPHFPLLFDPQTSGGLLFGVPADRAEAALDELLASGHTAAIIGTTGKAEAIHRIRISTSLD
ncbi:MAG: selenide, water dikinase SelD [bacterium]|nr:selenide, water dikinase SelD [bacterium]